MKHFALIALFGGINALKLKANEISKTMELQNCQRTTQYLENYTKALQDSEVTSGWERWKKYLNDFSDVNQKYQQPKTAWQNNNPAEEGDHPDFEADLSKNNEVPVEKQEEDDGTTTWIT